MRTILLLTGLAILTSGCYELSNALKGKGDRDTIIIEPGEFREIDLTGAYEVILRESSEEKVIIETEENLLEHFDVNVRHDKLYIDSERMLYSEKGIKVVIFYKEIEEIDIEGACALTSEDIIDTDYLKIDMGGAGALELELDVEELSLNIAGAGAVQLKGYAKIMDVNMSGAGGLSAFDLKTRKCNIDISGVGSADINVEDELSATIGGMGGINYKGNPDIRRSDVSGLGKISNAD